MVELKRDVSLGCDVCLPCFVHVVELLWLRQEEEHGVRGWHLPLGKLAWWEYLLEDFCHHIRIDAYLDP